MQVSPAELPWARHSAPAHFEQNPVLEATTRTQKEGYLPHSHPTRKVRVPENYVSERDKVLQVSLSLSLWFKGLYLYTVGISSDAEYCIR